MNKFEHMQRVLDEMFLDAEELEVKRVAEYWSHVDEQYDKAKNLGKDYE